MTSTTKTLASALRDLPPSFKICTSEEQVLNRTGPTSKMEEQPPPTQIHPIVVRPHNPHTLELRDLPNECPNPLDPTPWGLPAPIYSLPIKTDHPIITLWDSISKETIDILEKAELKWVAVECFHRQQDMTRKGSTENTTVLITLEKFPPAKDGLEEILDRIYEISGRKYFVELMQGRICRGSQRASNTALEGHLDDPQNTPYSSCAPPGGSIGMAGINWCSGTLGGYVELVKEGSTVKQCALTCHHVLLPAVDKSNPPEDHFVPYVKEKYKSFVAEEENLEQPDSRVRQRLESRRKIISEHENLKEAEISSESEIGSVLATSGLGAICPGGHQLDWGLVELKPGRFGTNASPAFPRSIRSECLSNYRPVDGERVIQIGSQSGLVHGVVNGVKSCICFRGSERELRTDEWAVIASSENPARPATHSFCLPGDSGSLVVSEKSEQVVGLLWGRKECLFPYTEPAYFTPINEVAAHIREVTEGYQIRIPQASDN